MKNMQALVHLPAEFCKEAIKRNYKLDFNKNDYFGKEQEQTKLKQHRRHTEKSSKLFNILPIKAIF